jgi:hypothetical protein
MAGKETGLGWTTCSVDDSAGSAQAIKGDITNMEIATPRGVQVVTGLDAYAEERLLLLADASITFNGTANFDANRAHAVFKTVPSTSVARTVTNVVASQTLAMEMLLTDYALTRGTDGSFTWTVPGVLASGLVPTWS